MELVNEARAFHNNVEAAEDMRIVEIPYEDAKDTGATENGTA
jgi:hypothetical protein